MFEAFVVVGMIGVAAVSLAGIWASAGAALGSGPPIEPDSAIRIAELEEENAQLRRLLDGKNIGDMLERRHD